MNFKITQTLSPLCLSLVLSGQALAQTAPASPVRSGTLKSVVGEVRLMPDQAAGGARVAQPGGSIQTSDRIVTGPGGSAAFILRDGTSVSVGPNTSLALSRFAFDSTTQRGSLVLDLLHGSMRMVTGLLARINPELVQVTTPTSLVGVRGTDFVVEAF